MITATDKRAHKVALLARVNEGMAAVGGRDIEAMEAVGWQRDQMVLRVTTDNGAHFEILWDVFAMFPEALNGIPVGGHS